MKHNLFLILTLLLFYFCLLIVQYYSWCFIEFDLISFNHLKNTSNAARTLILLINLLLLCLLVIFFKNHCKLPEN